MIQIEEVKLPNLGVISTRVPDRLYEQLIKQIKVESINGKSQTYTDNLVGAIRKEDIILLDPDLELFVLEVADHYFAKYFPNEQVVDVEIVSAWVNYQQRYEYNPLHDHDGQLSFVMWIEIPYDIEQERDYFPNRKKDGVSSSAAFQMMYNAIDGTQAMYDIPISKEHEGMMIMFPAKMKHQVYPFMTVDGTRISVAGNLGPISNF